MRALAATLALCLALPVAAGEPLADALDALRAGRLAEGVLIYRDLAEAGDGRAQFNLGLLYLDGLGVPQSHAEALYWGWRARLSGVAEAPALIARLAPHATPDLRAALAARLMADLQPRIDRGEGRAMLELAGVWIEVAPDPDPAQAFVWQALAAALGVAGAAAARDATGRSLAPEARLRAEAQAKEVLAGLCAKGMRDAPICAALPPTPAG
ncbi:MAG: hypothetical protein RIR62_1094 [Pseudomonadota bacterium]|jgi:TPR repeat protein